VGPRRRFSRSPAGYPVKLAVSCDNRPGMLKQIATVISDANTNIQTIEAKTAEDHATVELVADIADLKHWSASFRRAQDSRRAGCAAAAETVGGDFQPSAVSPQDHNGRN